MSAPKLDQAIQAALFAFTLTLVSLALSGCGDLSSSMGNGQPDAGQEKAQPIDAVKMISPSIGDPRDARAMNQRSYWISMEGRLLLRFESLTSALPRIMADKPVRLRIFATDDANKQKGLASLRLCPITKNWMMLATWEAGFPAKGGGWTPGGQIELDDCVSPEAPITKPVPPVANVISAGSVALQCNDPLAICFDVSSWFSNYVLQTGQNFGLALISFDGQAVQVVGDASGSRGPRMHWFEPTLPRGTLP